MNVTIKIDCDNAAFADLNCGAELARILRGLAEQIESCAADDFKRDRYDSNITLRDVNGNTVGTFRARD